jgi:ATP-binding cassette, subfamily B, multidrug efflux pump
VTSLFRLYRFLRPYRMQALVALLLLFGMVAADLVVPHLTQRIIDRGILANDLHVVITTALFMVGASIISTILALINNTLSVTAAVGFGANLRSALFKHVQSFSFGNLDRLWTGALIVRSTSDINTVQIIVMLSLRILTRAPIWALGAIVLLVFTSPRLALVMAVFVPLITALVWLVARRAGKIFLTMQRGLDRLNTVLQENLAGIRVVKAFVRTAHEIARFDDANQALMDRTIRASQLMAIFSPFMLLLLNLAIVSAVWLGGRFALTGEMSVGQVVAAINYLSFALFPILLLGGMLGPLSAAEASAMRILEILDDPSQVRPPDRPVTLGRPRGRIVFEKVAFSYNGNGAEPVLSDVSFTAEPGETVAILGATGSGKSTLIHLIPRFYDVTAGKVSFDGTDLRHLDLPWLRSTVGLVLQESVLFGGTVRDNICFGRMAATDAEVKAAARAAQAEAFIDALPHGYATVIGQRGVTLSGGQRQRIAIARALLVKPKVLILDDATSALDIETEIRLQDALERLISRSQDTTTRFVVAQRISTVLLADKILLLDQGRIKAMGTHRELLDRDVTYQDIYRSQLGEPPGKSGGQHG